MKKKEINLGEDHLTLAQVKKFLEHKYFSVRGDFINEYHFKDNYLDYYRKYLLENSNVKDRLFLSDVIDLSGSLQLDEDIFFEKYLEFLFEKKHFIVKLAVLDYLRRVNKTYEKKEMIEARLLQFLGQRLNKILRNQTLMLLIMLRTEKVEEYKTALLKSLAQTDDYRSFVRTMNILKDDYDFFSFLGKNYFNKIIDLALSKYSDGLAVTSCVDDLVAFLAGV